LGITATLILFYIGHHSFQAIRQTGNCKSLIFFYIAISMEHSSKRDVPLSAGGDW
jgi:hypothetical protein